jgi:hypothetical protein
VLLLYSFIAFRFYSVHYETRSHELLRSDIPLRDSLCPARIIFIKTCNGNGGMITLSLRRHMCSLISFQQCFCVALTVGLLHLLITAPVRPPRRGGLSACIYDGRIKTLIFLRETLKSDVVSE